VKGKSTTKERLLIELGAGANVHVEESEAEEKNTTTDVDGAFADRSGNHLAANDSKTCRHQKKRGIGCFFC